MTEFRENLLDRIIRIYGFEHKVTIFFARCCENPNLDDEYLERIVRDHETHPYLDDEEDEE